MPRVRMSGALADHVALRALAQIREDAQPGDAPTILRLFDRAGAGTGAAAGIKLQMQHELVR